MQVAMRPRKYKKSTVLMAGCLLIALMIFAGFFNRTAMLLAVALSLVIIAASDVDAIIPLMFFLMPFMNIFKISYTPTSMFTLLTFWSVLRLAFINFRKKIKIGPFLWIMSLGLYMIVFGAGSSVGWKYTITLIAAFLLLFLAGNADKKPEFRDVVIFFSAGIIAASSIALMGRVFPQIASVIRGAQIKMVEGINVDYVGRFSGLTGNPNYYTLDVIMALCALVVLFVSRKIKNEFYLLAVPLAVFGFMSISKSFAVALLFLVLIYVFVSAGSGPVRMIQNIFVLGLLAAAVYFFLGHEYITGYIYRLTGDIGGGGDLSALTTERSDIWEMYWVYLKTHPKSFFGGDGIGAPDLYRLGTHSLYFDLLYRVGLVGTVLYIGTLLSIFWSQKAKIKRTFINFIPLLMILVRGFAIGLMLQSNLYYYFMLSFLALNIDLGRKGGAKKTKHKTLGGQSLGI